MRVRTTGPTDIQPADANGYSARVDRLVRLVGPLVIATSIIALMFHTWLRWTDPQVDYGHTLYVAWQLSEGKVLYRDVQYMYGPLSPYFNALVFRVLGTHLLSQVFVNLAILIVLVVMLHNLLRAMSNRLVATLSCLLMVLVFAFSQLTNTANYNYMTPYAHEMVHGFVLGIGSLFALLAWLRSQRAVWAAASGLCCGLAFLVKPELFLAAAVATVFGYCLAIWLRQSHRQAGLISMLNLFGMMILPSIVTYAIFRSSLPESQALSAVLGAWMPMIKPGMTGLSFYKVGMGTDDVPGNLLRMIGCSAVAAVLIVIVAVISKAMGKLTNATLIRCICGLVILPISFIGSWAAWPPPLAAHQLTSALPVFAGIAGLVMLGIGYKQRRDSAILAQNILAAVFCIYALAMLLKMLLNARLHHYGFVLAVPASMIVAVCLLSWIPMWINRRRGAGVVFQSAAAGFLFGAAACVLQVSHRTASERIYPVNTAGDRFLADFRGDLVNNSLVVLDEQLQPQHTLAVLPEGVMINYLTRRINPTGFTSYLPSDIAVHGEQTILNAFKANPPDFIIVMHRDTSEFDQGPFGTGYAKDLFGWIISNYRLQAQLGEMPVNERVGLVLLKRMESPEKPPSD